MIADETSPEPTGFLDLDAVDRADDSEPDSDPEPDDEEAFDPALGWGI